MTLAERIFLAYVDRGHGDGTRREDADPDVWDRRFQALARRALMAAAAFRAVEATATAVPPGWRIQDGLWKCPRCGFEQRIYAGLWRCVACAHEGGE